MHFCCEILQGQQEKGVAVSDIHLKFVFSANHLHHYDVTRKLWYRKDDRAMRFIHACPENFRDSLIMPTATISDIFHWPLFRSTL